MTGAGNGTESGSHLSLCSAICRRLYDIAAAGSQHAAFMID